MYYLTNNTIQMEGRTLVQIKKYAGDTIIYGGYVDKEYLPQSNSWVDKNSYLINTVIKGRVIIERNCILRNCKIIGNSHIYQGCEFTHCYIYTPIGKGNHFTSNIKLTNQYIAGIGEYGSDICNDGDFENDSFNGVFLNITQHYFHVNCMTLTYERANEIISNDNLWNEFKERHANEPHIFTPDTKMWLQYWVDKKVKR